MLIPKENAKLQRLIDKESHGSQNAFAELIGVTQTNINRLFRVDDRNGEVPNVLKSKSVLKAISNKFPFATLEWFKKDDDLNSIEAISVDFKQMQVMYVPLVNQYAYGGYMNGFGDHEYIDSLPKIPFSADQEHKGEYLCFEVKGDSMDDGTVDAILERDILLCRNVRKEHWINKIHINRWDFVIVHREKGIVVKRITKHDVEKGILTLHSLNEDYEDYDVHLKDISQILNIVDIKRNRKR